MNGSSRSAKRDWATVTGPHAFCTEEACGFFYHGDQDHSARETLRLAREHADDTRHEVFVERGQLTIVSADR